MAFLPGDPHPVCKEPGRRLLEGARDRESREVAHVPASGPAQLVDHKPAPAGEICRSELDHPERTCRPGINEAGGKACASRTDERIHRLRITFLDFIPRIRPGTFRERSTCGIRCVY